MKVQFYGVFYGEMNKTSRTAMGPRSSSVRPFCPPWILYFKELLFKFRKMVKKFRKLTKSKLWLSTGQFSKK
jgi:hypothetical protein